MRRIEYCLIFLMILLLPLSAFGLEPKHGGTLNASIYHDARSMDPHRSASFVDRQIFQNVYNTLVTYDEDLNLVPELAESWTRPDPKTYIFKLKKGIKFHDGTDFDAEVVKFNIERVLDPKTKSRGKGEISAVESVDVIDRYTVRFNLSYPFTPLFAGLSDRAGFMISPTALEKMGPDEFLQHPVGTGPFKFVEWVRDGHIILDRFDGYWEKGLPYLDRIVFKPIPDQDVKLINLKSGTLHMIDDVLPKDIASVKANKDLVLQQVPSFGLISLRLNCTKPPFNNKALRQALTYAIDREAIWKHIYKSTGILGHGPIAPSSWAYDPENFRYHYDPEKAKQKLQEGGKPNGFKFKIYTKQEPIDVQVCQAIQAQVRPLGIEIEIQQLTGVKHLTVMLKHDYEGNFGLWSGYPEPDTNLYRQYHPKGSAHWTGYTHPKVTEYLDKARASMDQAERKELYSKALDLIIRDAPMVYMYYYPRRQGLSKKVHGFVLFPDGKPRLKKVWLE